MIIRKGEHMNSTKKTITSILVWYILSISISIFIFPFFANKINIFHNINNINIYFSAINEIFSVAVLGWLILGCKSKNSKIDRTNNTTNENVNYANIFISILIVVLLAYAIINISNGIESIKIGRNDDFSNIITREKDNYFDFAIKVLLLAFVPAVCEEFVYRLLFVKALTKENKLILLLSPLLFAFSHIQSNFKISYFIIGFYLLIVYLQTKKFWLIVTLHFIYNFIQIFHYSLHFLNSDTNYITRKYFTSNNCIVGGIKYMSIGLFLYGLATILYGFQKNIIIKRNKYE